jgi:hypothetical protein
MSAQPPAKKNGLFDQKKDLERLTGNLFSVI